MVCLCGACFGEHEQKHITVITGIATLKRERNQKIVFSLWRVHSSKYTAGLEFPS